MSRSIKKDVLIQIARRNGTVRWRKSGIVELLAMKGDVVMATSHDGPHLHPLDMTYERYNCTEVGVPSKAPPQVPLKAPPAPTLKNTPKPQTAPTPKQRFDARREQTIQVMQRRAR